MNKSHDKCLPQKSDKSAFTLAEVLITLGIIGVVAAMTLPAIVHNYKKQEIEAKLKKFYTTMSQAVKMSEIENGPAFYWSKSPRIDDGNGGNGGNAGNRDGVLAFYNTYLAKYLKKTAEIDKGGTSISVMFADGTAVRIGSGYCFDIHFDYNGAKPPNTQGVDMFDFLLCTEEGYNAGLLRNRQNPFDAYFPSHCNRKGCTREQLISSCKSNPISCSSLIMYDGWKINDDYPFKI